MEKLVFTVNYRISHLENLNPNFANQKIAKSFSFISNIFSLFKIQGSIFELEQKFSFAYYRKKLMWDNSIMPKSLTH